MPEIKRFLQKHLDECNSQKSDIQSGLELCTQLVHCFEVISHLLRISSRAGKTLNGIIFITFGSQSAIVFLVKIACLG